MKKTNTCNYTDYKTAKILVIITMLITIISILGVTTFKASADNSTIIVCKSASDVVRLTKKKYDNPTFNHNYEPIGIGPAIHINGNFKENVYIVTLLGTKFISDDTGIQSTEIITDVLAGFDINNPYLSNVKRRIFETIPKGSKIVLSGHSLGGMICQEISADRSIKENYKVINTLTFGSPLCAYSEGRAGNVIRLCDTWDPVPLLSRYTLTHYEKQFYERERFVEDGDYGLFSMFDAHCYSYLKDDVWGKYDAFGYLGGKNQISVDYTQMKYFPTPMFK